MGIGDFMIDTKFDISGGNLHISMPFSKVDQSKRTVYGFATLDNVDKVNDVVLASASEKAFSKFRGNVREMHDGAKAVGRVVSFRTEPYYDSETDKLYKGVFVSTYISRGAEDTWEKVLDGTLTGFSIGAVVTDSDSEYDPDSGKVVRVIKEYELVELSIVDSPMNNLANVFGFEKGVQTGYAAKTNTENVFFCREHNVVQFSGDSFAECHRCGQSMSNIGFVESDDDEKINVVKGMLDNVKNVPLVGDYVDFDSGFGVVDNLVTTKMTVDENEIDASESNPLAIISICNNIGDTIVKTNYHVVKSLSEITTIRKGVDQVSDEVKETTDVVEPVETEQVGETEEVEVTNEETSDSNVDFKSEIASLTGLVEKMAKTVTDLSNEVAKALKSAEEATAEAVESRVESKAAKADLEKANKQIQSLGEQLERVDSATAIRKSAEVGEIEQAVVSQEVRTIWGGSFLPSEQN